MIARISNNIYMIKGDYSIYLIIEDEEAYLIDSSSGNDSEFLLEGIEEITTQYNIKVNYLILTSHIEEVAGGAFYLSKILKIPYVIASEEDAKLIRKGKGKKNVYPPVSVNFEIKLNNFSVNNLKIIKTKTPSKGSISVLYSNILFSGADKVSGYLNKVNYICDIFECKKVEEFWFLRKSVNHVEDIQKQNTVE